MLTSKIPLTFDVGPRAANQQGDVMVVQLVLAAIKPRPGVPPYYSGQIDGRFGPKTEAAVRAFQVTQNEQADAPIRVNGSSHRKLVDEAEREVRSWPRPPKPHLTFDGRRLCWQGHPHNGKCWNGVSGEKDHQSKEHQNVIDKGPLPEGRWRVRQSEFQTMDDEPLIMQMIWGIWPGQGMTRLAGDYLPIGGTNWPGGTAAWGRNRVWLHPLGGTNTYGRSGFSIHGGNEPGSAGCVDLTGQMPDFIKHFRAYGADMDLEVRY